MAHLSLKLLGSYRLNRDEAPIHNIESDKARGLLAYLAVERDQPQPREKLVGLFWPDLDEEHARGSLSQAVYHLRGLLGDRAATGSLQAEGNRDPRQPCLLVSTQAIQLNPACDFETDVATFFELVAAIRTHAHPPYAHCDECHERRQQAARLYTGDFMDGFYLPKNLAFEEWVTITREHLRLEALSVFEQLVQTFTQQGELEDALVSTRRMIALDELGEAGNAHLMQLLALLSRRDEALIHYRNYHQALAIQLGAEPSQEIRLLYQRLHGEQIERETRSLPASLTPFIGRKRELNELWGWLHDPRRRLICILGAGGSGKTRLALEAARRQRYHFTDGVYYVPLSALGAGSSLLATIAERVGFTFRDLGDHKQQLLDYLRLKQILLILDSFETVVESAGLVAELLSASAGSKALVTSRVRLNLSEEQVYSLAGMRFPSKESSKNISDYSAVEMFLEAARRVKPDYPAEDLEEIAHICRLVEGMPLSLLLASSWVGEYTPREIAEQIERNLDFLAVEWADLPERQRSLRATYEYSWDLLSPKEQQTLMSLAVFRNPFNAQAARQVTGATLQLLHSLVGKSLLGSASEGQYQMHDLVRQYSYEKLALDVEGHERTARQKHSQYFLDIAAGWSKQFKSPDQSANLNQADRVIEDVKAAWECSSQQADTSIQWQACEGLMLFYDLRYRFPEGEQACRVALEGLNDAPLAGESLSLEGWLLAWQAHFNRMMGRLALARQLVDQSIQRLSQAEAAGADARQGEALLWRERGYLAGNLPEQVDGFQYSAALFQVLGETWWQSGVLSWTGELLSRQGDRLQALEMQQFAVALSRAAGEPRLMARSLMYLAYNQLIHWNWQAGAQLMEEAALLYRSAGDLGSQANAELHLGVSRGWLGRFLEAYEMVGGALDKLNQLGDRYYIVYGTGGMAVGLTHLGRYAEAVKLLQGGLSAAKESGFKREEAFWLAQQGCLALVQGEAEQALPLIQQSVADFRKMGFAAELAMAIAALALAQHTLGQEQAAWVSMREALPITVESHSRFTFWTLPATLVVLLADSGRWEQAVEAFSALMTDPIVANSRWFVDLLGERMDQARERLPEEIFLAAEQRGLQGDIFEALGRLEKTLNE